MAGLNWSTSSDGGYLYADEISDVLRMELLDSCKFRQLADVEDFTDKGAHAGATVHWDVTTRVLQKGTRLAEGTAIPETKFKILQGTATITEYGNSVPYSGKLETLSKYQVSKIVKNALAIDAKETLDTEVYNEFNATKLRVVGGTGGTITLTTNGTATATNNQDLSNSHVKTIVNEMKERNIPPYLNDDYFAIARPTTWRPLEDDLETIFQHTSEGFQRIVKGVKGRYAGCQFIEQTHIDSENWSSNQSDWAFFFGADLVAEIIVIPEEIRGKIPGDYGRDKGIAWYAMLGYSLIHKGDGTQGQVEDVRILKWDSAA